jgi:hypothetical protein
MNVTRTLALPTNDAVVGVLLRFLHDTDGNLGRICPAEENVVVGERQRASHVVQSADVNHALSGGDGVAAVACVVISDEPINERAANEHCALLALHEQSAATPLHFHTGICVARRLDYSVEVDAALAAGKDGRTAFVRRFLSGLLSYRVCVF